MAKYVINEDYGDPIDVEADEFLTSGEFVDFHATGKGVVYRIKATNVQTIKRKED